MPLLVLILAMAVAAVVAGFLVHRAPRLALAASIASLVVVAVAIAAAALTVSGPLGIDTALADWAHAHATPFTTDVLSTLTDVGQPETVLVLAIVFGVVETVRTRNWWTAVFLVAVVGGNALLTTGIKDLVDRVRPDLDPTAASLGPSFPSGHSSWSAAFFAAAAFLLARGRSPRTQALLAAAAAAIAVGVATTRVLLAVHWFSDVAVGLTLGWAWFAVCALTLGRVRSPTADPGASRRSPSGQAAAPRP
jgi:undecaprenyl-diphosphatase